MHWHWKEGLRSNPTLAGFVQDLVLPEDGALPQQPSSLHRSPSVEELLRKVQCVDARQVSGTAVRRGGGNRYRFEMWWSWSDVWADDLPQLKACGG